MDEVFSILSFTFFLGDLVLWDSERPLGDLVREELGDSEPTRKLNFSCVLWSSYCAEVDEGLSFFTFTFFSLGDPLLGDIGRPFGVLVLENLGETEPARKLYFSCVLRSLYCAGFGDNFLPLFGFSFGDSYFGDIERRFRGDLEGELLGASES